MEETRLMKFESEKYRKKSWKLSGANKIDNFGFPVFLEGGTFQRAGTLNLGVVVLFLLPWELLFVYVNSCSCSGISESLCRCSEPQS